MTNAEYEELKALARIEPVGPDLIAFQLARTAQAFAGGKFKDHLLICQEYRQTPDQIKHLAEMFKRGNNSNARHGTKSKDKAVRPAD